MLATLRRIVLTLGWLSSLAGVLAFIFGQISYFIGLMVLAATLWASSYQMRQLQFWRGTKAHRQPLLHLDVAMAVRPTVLGQQPDLGYRLASLFFQTGLIDRTRRAQAGIKFDVLYPIPAVPVSPGDIGSFADLCARRARNIVSEAKRRNVQIHLLWSGGIDSTTACVALIDALGDDTRRLEIFETAASRREYRHFSKRVLGRKFKRHRIHSAGDAFNGKAIVVTGEYGDQLFGSAKALDQSLARLKAPWEPGLQAMLHQQLGSELRATKAYGFLSPAIRAAPVPIPDLWTALWWLNFSMKWQAVGLRMFGATRGLTLTEFRHRTFHFFGTDDFQRWALVHAGEGLGRDLSTYKWPARDVIRKATGDTNYAETKNKEPSLRGLLPKTLKSTALAIDAGGTILFQPIDRSLKEAGSATSGTTDETETGFAIEFSATSSDDPAQAPPKTEPDFDPSREQPLWDALDSDGE